jgi:hypothetical protein
MKFINFATALLLVFFFSACSEEEGLVTDPTTNDDSESTDCSNVASVFTLNLDPSTCNVNIETKLSVSSIYTESISGTTRKITINGIASHLVGTFPNSGNPNTISTFSENFSITTRPQLASTVTSAQRHTFGVLFSGVSIDPFTGEFFQGTGGINRDWNITTLQSTRSLGLDCNNAHVQPTGKYHYHGTPSKLIDELGTADGTQMIKVGYAGDGFPIYYKYGFNDAGTQIIELISGYSLKTEERGGDGQSAPDGCPDGYYFQDYVYTGGILDECNGRTGKTPESENEYYYVITDNFPSSPLCFSGTPDASYRF